MGEFDTIDDGSNITTLPSVDPAASSSPVSLDYWKQKLSAFIALLQNIDPVYYNLQSAVADLQVVDTPEAQAAYLQGLDLLAQYENNRAQVQGVVSGVNTVIDTLNSLGMSLPKAQGLNGLTDSMQYAMYYTPIFGPMLMIQKLLMSWMWNVNSFTDYVKTIVPQEAQDTWDNLKQSVNTAIAAAQDTASVAVSAVKWVAVGVAVYFAMKFWKEFRE